MTDFTRRQSSLALRTELAALRFQLAMLRDAHDLEREERKFNPNQRDDNGQFSFGPVHFRQRRWRRWGRRWRYFSRPQVVRRWQFRADRHAVRSRKANQTANRPCCLTRSSTGPQYGRNPLQ